MNPQREAEVVKEVTEGMGMTCTNKEPPATIEELYERMRWDGSLGGRPVRLSQETLKKREVKRKNKQRAAKAARKRNRK